GVVAGAVRAGDRLLAAGGVAADPHARRGDGGCARGRRIAAGVLAPVPVVDRAWLPRAARLPRDLLADGGQVLVMPRALTCARLPASSEVRPTRRSLAMDVRKVMAAMALFMATGAFAAERTEADDPAAFLGQLAGEWSVEADAVPGPGMEPIR